MTLQEAHEIQRKELMSLRRQVSKFEMQISEVLPLEIKEELEHQIRSRDYTINCLKKEIRTSNAVRDSFKRQYNYAESQCYDLSSKVSSLEHDNKYLLEENAVLKGKIALLENEVNELNGTTANLQSKLNINFENSSFPSSALPFRKKVPNSRKSSGKSQGAQKGHPGHTATRLAPTLEPIHLKTPDNIVKNPYFYPTGKTIMKQLIDISIHISVRDYIADEYRNRLNGSRYHAPFPNGVINNVNYGPSLKSFAFLLNNYYNVSIDKTRQCISDFTKGVISISNGTICNLSKEFSVATKDERNKIFSRLLHSDVLYSDATVSNINGNRNTVILCSNASDVLFTHSKRKGFDGLNLTPLKDYEGTVIHDHDKSYYSYGKHHQECLAHILRYLIGANENEPNLTWHKQMHSLLQEMIHTSKECNRNLTNKQINLFETRYEKILGLAAKEYISTPPSKYYTEGYNLYKRLDNYKQHTLYFLRHPEVDYSNNFSERELRKFKRKQKQAVVLRSFDGGQRICDALTIIESARLKSQNILWITESVFSKTY